MIDLNKARAWRRSGRVSGRTVPSDLDRMVHNMTGRQKLEWVIKRIREATEPGQLIGDWDLLREALKDGTRAASRHKVKGKLRARDEDLLAIWTIEIIPKLVEFGLDGAEDPIDESGNEPL